MIDYLYPEYDGKPFSYVTVSSGRLGGVNALNSLQNKTLDIGGKVGPHLLVSEVQNVFNTETGELEDQDYKEKFDQFIKEAVEHTLEGI